jgi:3-dehydroquinate dehydratase-2
MKVLFLFGPNLGALGRRDMSIYGSESLGDIMRSVEERATSLGHDLSWRQSDHEGDLVGSLLAAADDGVGAVVINPGALTHYSYALRDAIEACGLPVVEVHMSNIYAREDFRQRSVVSGVCRASIIGLGAGGYHLALEAMPWIT